MKVTKTISINEYFSPLWRRVKKKKLKSQRRNVVPHRSSLGSRKNPEKNYKLSSIYLFQWGIFQTHRSKPRKIKLNHSPFYPNDAFRSRLNNPVVNSRNFRCCLIYNKNNGHSITCDLIRETFFPDFGIVEKNVTGIWKGCHCSTLKKSQLRNSELKSTLVFCLSVVVQDFITKFPPVLSTPIIYLRFRLLFSWEYSYFVPNTTIQFFTFQSSSESLKVKLEPGNPLMETIQHPTLIRELLWNTQWQLTLIKLFNNIV